MLLHRMARILFLFVFLLAQLLTTASITPVKSQNDKVAQSTSQPWITAKAGGGVIFILNRYPNTIRRYSMATRAWLPDIALSGVPTSLHVGADFLYVALGNKLYRMGLDGSNPVHFYTSPNNPYGNLTTQINEILEYNNVLFVAISLADEWRTGGELFSINKTTGASIAGPTVYGQGFSIAPNSRVVYYATSSSPSFFTGTAFNTDGTFGPPLSDPYSGDYSYGMKIWVFPDETEIADSGGMVYGTDLKYKDTLTDAVTDLLFVGQLPVALRQNTLLTFDDHLLEEGLYNLTRPAWNIFTDGQSIFALGGTSALAPTVDVVPLTAITPPVPDAPLDPARVSFIPDDMVLGTGGILYLMSSTNKSIFRWSIVERRYLETIPLARQPQYMAYAPEANRLFLGYKERFLTRIDLNQSLEEIPIGFLPSSPCGIVVLDSSTLVTCNGSMTGYGFTYSAYNMDGLLLSTAWSSSSGSFGWDPFRRRTYLFEPKGTGGGVHYYSFNIDNTGHIGEIDSHWFENESFHAPFRLSPDGSVFLLGTGQINNAATLATLKRLPTPINDGLWKGQTLFTIMEDYSTYPMHTRKIQKWNADYTIQTTVELPNDNLRIFPTAEGLMAVTRVDSTIRYVFLDDNLNILGSSPIADFTAENVTGYAPLTVTFTNASVGEGNSYLWDFGDGEISTEISPSHTYTSQGRYTVNLTVTNPFGVSIKAAVDLVSAKVKLFLPLTTMQHPTKTFENMCHTFPLNIYGAEGATITECVTQTTLPSAKQVRVFFTWKLSGYRGTQCVSKGDDSGNPNMYLTDQKGNHYDMTGAGGDVGYIYCMGNNVTYTGWFNFPPPLVANPAYTFHDDDNHLQFYPITLPLP